MIILIHDVHFLICQPSQTKQQMRVESMEERLVSQEALRYTKEMILNLTISINKFKQGHLFTSLYWSFYLRPRRENFNDYARKSLDRLTRNIVSTSNALKSNKWLAGAKLIHNVVQGNRSLLGKQTKPFEEWLGIQQEVESLAMGTVTIIPRSTDF